MKRLEHDSRVGKKKQTLDIVKLNKTTFQREKLGRQGTLKLAINKMGLHDTALQSCGPT